MAGQMKNAGNGHLHRGNAHMPEAERLKWQNPDLILREIGLTPGHTFVDIGCGKGYFTLPAARLVGNKGTVYGVDTDKNAITILRRSAEKEGLFNIILTEGEAEKTLFCTGCADFIFLGIVLHDFRDPIAVLRNAAAMIKLGGKLVDLDWLKEPMPFGPPLEIRFTEEKAKNIITSAGFKIASTSRSGLYHYIITAKLQSASG